MKLKLLGPSFEEEVGRCFALRSRQNRGVVLPPFQSLEQSLRLHGTFP